MTKISSPTFIYKKVFPAFWFGFLAIFFLLCAIQFLQDHDPMLIVMLIAPIFMAGFGFFMFKNLVWGLADEVFDAGDYLLVRMRGEEDRISLSNIMNVGYSRMNPQQVTLRLVEPMKFGSEISFMPVRSRSGFQSLFGKNKMVEDLIRRVYDARPKR
ncbi:hypothetical protein LLG95_09445 [bacterium]|nr:hypothetical protein [bacterium]